MEITSSLRQGFYLLFIILFMFIGQIYFKMSMFELFLIVSLAGIIMKLTDIEEAVKK